MFLTKVRFLRSKSECFWKNSDFDSDFDSKLNQCQNYEIKVRIPSFKSEFSYQSQNDLERILTLILRSKSECFWSKSEFWDKSQNVSDQVRILRSNSECFWSCQNVCDQIQNSQIKVTMFLIKSECFWSNSEFSDQSQNA